MLSSLVLSPLRSRLRAPKVLVQASGTLQATMEALVCVGSWVRFLLVGVHLKQKVRSNFLLSSAAFGGRNFILLTRTVLVAAGTLAKAEAVL